jgi:Domain of unknown function (DUF4357)
MTAGVEGRSLELYFIDGKPDGMLTAEVFNWTGHVLMAPRTRLSAMLARKEANYTGVYILIGEQDGEPLAYIGEGEDISYRIKNHDAKKDWWTQAILVTSTANNLHKAHVKYLEARLIEEAKTARRSTLENGTTPARPSLSEAAQANMEVFLGNLLMVLPALRVDTFLSNLRPAAQPDKPLQPKQTFDRPVQAHGVTFELTSRKNEYHATAVLEDGEFVVQAGSKARKAWVGEGYGSSSYGNLYAELKKKGVLEEGESYSFFVVSYSFPSASAAAAVVTGRSANGLIEWKLKDTGQTYKEWELAQISLPELDL